MSAESKNPLLLAKLVALAVAMFMFAIFVLPPLYDLFCEITGIGGKTDGAYTAVAVEVDTSRDIEVQFVATKNAKAREVIFYAHNRTSSDMLGQAIPNVLPNNAADYFHKTECFCFNNQPLAAGESAELALVFIVDPDLPASVNTVTLSYTMFDITDRTLVQVSQVQ